MRHSSHTVLLCSWRNQETELSSLYQKEPFKQEFKQETNTFGPEKDNQNNGHTKKASSHLKHFKN
jgi:hypothetical protein